MLVYGDRSERADPRHRLDEIDQALRQAVLETDAIERHDALTNALIEAGRVLQGVADADFALAGCDRRSEATDRIGDYLLAIARIWCRSHDRCPVMEVPPTAPRDIDLPENVELKVPEGYAHYALYPEAYLEAARSLDLRRPARVIGIRSIGTSLAATVAAAVDAPRPITVRPFGQPYRRRIAVSPEVEAELLVGPNCDFLIVDEGPGQSGSSFGAVADWLLERGVAEARIIFMPSHDGAPGPQASSDHRARWSRARKAAADGDAQLRGLIESVAARFGPIDGPLQEISGGRWRSRVFASEADWPPVNPALERRKFIACAAGEPLLLKFAGLGEEGKGKLRRARVLHSAGLVPEPLGLVHGYLVERWVKDARPFPKGSKPVEELAEYIGTRARLLEADAGRGASLEQLLAMAIRNIGLALGDKAASGLQQWRHRLERLERCSVRRVETDGRLDRHEWLRLPDNCLLKADALDHCQSHDLIGCQDVAWDVAGAAIEFGLDEEQTAALAAATGRAADRLVDPELLQFMTIAYLAFRLGLACLSKEMVADAAEQRRFRASADRYARLIAHALGGFVPVPEVAEMA